MKAGARGRQRPRRGLQAEPEPGEIPAVPRSPAPLSAGATARFFHRQWSQDGDSREPAGRDRPRLHGDATAAPSGSPPRSRRRSPTAPVVRDPRPPRGRRADGGRGPLHEPAAGARAACFAHYRLLAPVYPPARRAATACRRPTSCSRSSYAFAHGFRSAQRRAARLLLPQPAALRLVDDRRLPRALGRVGARRGAASTRSRPWMRRSRSAQRRRASTASSPSRRSVGRADRALLRRARPSHRRRRSTASSSSPTRGARRRPLPLLRAADRALQAGQARWSRRSRARSSGWSSPATARPRASSRRARRRTSSSSASSTTTQLVPLMQRCQARGLPQPRRLRPGPGRGDGLRPAGARLRRRRRARTPWCPGLTGELFAAQEPRRDRRRGALVRSRPATTRRRSAEHAVQWDRSASASGCAPWSATSCQPPGGRAYIGTCAGSDRS